MEWADIVCAVLILGGSALALTAAIGVVRFPDTLSRMHSATKPQVLGLLLVLAGAAIRLRGHPDVGMIILTGMFTIITAPVVVMVSETVWIRDGRFSTRTPKVGSCTTGRAPAPSAPIAIRIVPVEPNSRVRRNATRSTPVSGEPMVRSSPCQRAIEEVSECGRAATDAA